MEENLMENSLKKDYNYLVDEGKQPKSDKTSLKREVLKHEINQKSNGNGTGILYGIIDGSMQQHTAGDNNGSADHRSTGSKRGNYRC